MRCVYLIYVAIENFNHRKKALVEKRYLMCHTNCSSTSNRNAKFVLQLHHPPAHIQGGGYDVNRYLFQAREDIRSS